MHWPTQVINVAHFPPTFYSIDEGIVKPERIEAFLTTNRVTDVTMVTARKFLRWMSSTEFTQEETVVVSKYTVGRAFTNHCRISLDAWAS